MTQVYTTFRIYELSHKIGPLGRPPAAGVRVVENRAGRSRLVVNGGEFVDGQRGLLKSVSRAPSGQERISRFPRIQNRHVGVREVADVARYHCKIVMQRGGREQTVDDR
jgi:hypothetical protein